MSNRGETRVRCGAFAAVESDESPSDVGWVADNLRVVAASLADPVAPLTHELLLSWHRDLMGHSRLPADMIGNYRTSPGWIGGTSPTKAAYVAPPAGHVLALMEDLVTYANSNRDDPITTATIAADRLDISTRAARSALSELGRRGIVAPTDLPSHASLGRAPQWWTPTQITGAISAWASGG